MKVGDKGSSFQKLAAAKVEQERRNEERASADNRIEDAVRSNEEAASTIARVAMRHEEPIEEAREVTVRERQEVEESVRAASDTKVEDVDRLTKMLAERIRGNRSEAGNAHNPTLEKVHQLLQ